MNSATPNVRTNQWPGTRFSDPAVLTTIERVLAFSILSFGIWTIVNTALIVVHSYSPVMFWDHWDIIRELMRDHGQITFRELWTQHNEHRPLTGKLLYFADLFWFHGRNKSLLIESFLAQICQLILFSAVAWRFGQLRRAAFLSLCGFLAYCFFSPLQVANLVWAFQTHFLLGGLFSVATFALAAWFSYLHSVEDGRQVYVFIAVLCSAFLAEASLASGLLTWPILLLVAFALPWPLMQRCVLAVVGVSAVAAYFAEYVSPEPLNLWQSLRHPLRLLKFVLTELSWSWDDSLPNGSVWPHFSEVLVCCLVLAVVSFVIRSLLHLKDPFLVFLVATFCYSLGSFGLTAVGRLKYGYMQAVESRYQSVAFLFWAAVAALVMALVSRRENTMRLIVVQAVTTILLLSTISRVSAMTNWAIERRASLTVGWNAMMQNPPQVNGAGMLYSHPETLSAVIGYLRQHDWGPRGVIRTPFYVNARTSLTNLPRGYTAASWSCSGFVDGVQGINGWKAHLWGWAYRSPGDSLTSGVVIADSRGNILKSASTHINRPDVNLALPSIQNRYTGWQATLDFPGDGPYSAFMIEENSHQACRLQNEIEVAR